MAENPFVESFNLLITFRHQCLIWSCQPTVQGIYLSLCLRILHNCCMGDPQQELWLCSCQWHSTFPAVRETLLLQHKKEPSSWLGEGRRVKTLLYNLLRCKRKSSLQEHSKHYNNSVHQSFSLLVQLALLELTATCQKGEEEWEKLPKPPKIGSNLTTLPLKMRVLAIMIKFIPLMLQQNLHKTMCLRRASFTSPPSSTRTGLFYR